VLKKDDNGILIDAILFNREQYIQALESLGWSSGTASHLVDYERGEKSTWLKTWPLGLDASMTPTPAEPRNTVIPLKSLSDLLPPIPEKESEPDAEQEPAESEPEPEAVKHNEKVQETPITQEELPMEDIKEEVKTITLTDEQISELVENAASKGAEKALESLPATKAVSNIEVELDEADRPFKSLAEQCKAVRDFEVSRGSTYDPRLKRIKATGAQESVPDQGGFLLEPDLGGEILRPMHETGPFTSLINSTSTAKNYGWLYGVDETSRATGSRWGGIRGYRLAEGDTLTASKPSFRRVTWELKKYAVLVYATDELLADASLFSQVVTEGAGEELSFMANDDVLNGLGAKGPLGILNSTALVDTTAETGQAATTIVFENISAMWARVPGPSKRRGYWFINTDCNPQLDQMYLAAGTGGLEPRFIGYDAQGVMRIKGRPVVETEFNATLGTSGDIMFIDPYYYLFWDKVGGIQSASSIHVQFTTDETAFRFIYRCDGRPAISAALTPYKGSNTLSPFVSLATRS
jgi:HK97 family phage major capsid protein